MNGSEVGLLFREEPPSDRDTFPGQMPRVYIVDIDAYLWLFP